jgi:hypothetical protein
MSEKLPSLTEADNAALAKVTDADIVAAKSWVASLSGKIKVAGETLGAAWLRRLWEAEG